MTKKQTPRKRKEFSEIEAQELAVGIIRLLDGVSIGHANWVLSETKQILNSTHIVDVSGDAFTEKVESIKAVRDCGVTFNCHNSDALTWPLYIPAPDNDLEAAPMPGSIPCPPV